MKANAVPLLAIFEKKIRLEVPLFQRQYVWTQEQQWEPLWEDIARKFTDYLEDRQDAPVHFLGAMVLDQKQTQTTHVEKRQVIDGQQRLTTFQIFLSAFRDFCRAQECEELAKECEIITLNKGMMADPKVDKFKVWPTQLDRKQFEDVVTAGSPEELRNRHPEKKLKYAHKPLPLPKMVAGYLFFYEQLEEFFLGTESEPPLAADFPIAARLEESFNALKNALQVVAIDLETGDDAQVIFETLNARGEPLLPADLLRNFIFLRATRQGEPAEELYDNYWSRFDDDFWRVEVRQGRLTRPRSDLFLQHFLASRLTADIPIKHLFVEYKYWIDRKKPYKTVKEELQALAQQGDDFRRILEPQVDDPLYGIATFVEAFDVRTTYPLLLTFLDANIDAAEWVKVSTILESYLLRRFVCGLTTKSYNRIFLSLTRLLRRDGITSANLTAHLQALSGESVEWPSDAAFSDAWRTEQVYETLNNAKLVHILKRLSNSYLGSKTEPVVVSGALSVEHILPQAWVENWLLPGGDKGMSLMELWDADPSDPRAKATRRRNELVHTFGNLTIVTQALNSAASNGGWDVKKTQILNHSVLPINNQLAPLDKWDENAITARGEELLKRALVLWPRI